MLWSLLKILIFVVIIALITLGAGFLIETGSAIRIAAAGMEFTLSPLAAAIAFMALTAVIWLGLKLIALMVAVLHFINGDETAISRFFDRNRERRGFQALADAMMALASGEGKLALNKVAKAERFLDRPELTRLLTAQAAEQTGDTRKAGEVYRKLLADERTRFVGVRGLMKQKLAEGDTATALKLAAKAFALKPRHEEVQDTLFRLQAGSQDWSGARVTLAQKLRSRSLPRDVHTRRDAVLALAEARSDLSDGDTAKATMAALQANRLSPELVPAAVLAARAKISEGAPRVATRIIRRAWAATPHPDLAAAFAAIEPGETPQARIKRFHVLIRSKPDDPESHMLSAELAIAAEDFPAARRAMGDLPETAPSQRALTIMAAIERGEGAADQVVRAWLTRALSAPRGPQWICTNCNHIHAAWVPACENCASIDTLSWQDPPEIEEVAPGPAEMLPLIVGEPDMRDADPEAAQGIDEAEIVPTAVADARRPAPDKDDTDAEQATPPAPEAPDPGTAPEPVPNDAKPVN